MKIPCVDCGEMLTIGVDLITLGLCEGCLNRSLKDIPRRIRRKQTEEDEN